MNKVVKKVVKKSGESDRAREYFFLRNPIEFSELVFTTFFTYFFTTFSPLFHHFSTTFSTPFYTHLLKETIYIYLLITINIFVYMKKNRWKRTRIGFKSFYYNTNKIQWIPSWRHSIFFANHNKLFQQILVWEWGKKRV